MADITYEVMVDWDMTDWSATPDFSEAIDDISDDVQSINLMHGDDREEGNIPASTIEIRIKGNLYAKYSPYNTAGDLYGKLLPWRVIRIRATHNAVTYNVFFGFISKYKIDPDLDNPSVYLYCTDGVDLLARTLVTQDYNRRLNLTDGEAVEAVLDAAGWSSSRRDIDSVAGQNFQYPDTTEFKDQI